MKNLLKMGGITALIGAATNLFALGVFATLLVPNGFGQSSSIQRNSLIFFGQGEKMNTNTSPAKSWMRKSCSSPCGSWS